MTASVPSSCQDGPSSHHMSEIRIRVATTVDVPAIAVCRLIEPAAGPADPRVAAYFDGRHHPQGALLPRVGYVAVTGETIIGYIAGASDDPQGYAGEVQYLFAAPQYRRRGCDGVAALSGRVVRPGRCSEGLCPRRCRQSHCNAVLRQRGRLAVQKDPGTNRTISADWRVEIGTVPG